MCCFRLHEAELAPAAKVPHAGRIQPGLAPGRIAPEHLDVGRSNMGRHLLKKRGSPGQHDEKVTLIVFIFCNAFFSHGRCSILNSFLACLSGAHGSNVLLMWHPALHCSASFSVDRACTSIQNTTSRDCKPSYLAPGHLYFKRVCESLHQNSESLGFRLTQCQQLLTCEAMSDDLQAPLLDHSGEKDALWKALRTELHAILILCGPACIQLGFQQVTLTARRLDKYKGASVSQPSGLCRRFWLQTRSSPEAWEPMPWQLLPSALQ